MSVFNKLFSTKSNNMKTCTAVIVAAGSSQRMGTDKILMPLGDRPVIAHTLYAFQSCELIDELIVVTRYDSLQTVADICANYGIDKIRMVVEGGSTRAESAMIGISCASPDTELIAIHDGARPFVSREIIERVYYAASESGAAAPAVTPTDTVRLLNNRGAVISTPDRNLVALIQTPQIFDAQLIKKSLSKVIAKDIPITDDCAAVETAGGKVCIVDGDRSNLKLTSPYDIYLAKRILSEKGGAL